MATRFQFQRREAARVEQREQRRHRVDGAFVSIAGEEIGFEATLVDISSFGCRLADVPALDTGGYVWLRLPGAPPVEANVIWVRGRDAGCRFVEPISQTLMRSLLPSAV